MMSATLSLSRAARAGLKIKPSTTASISTSAAFDLGRGASDVQEFHERFWQDVASRRREVTSEDEANLSKSSSKAVESHARLSRDAFEADEDAILRKLAREDISKHFRMSAAFRAMKRGDGVMSDYFSLERKVRPRRDESHILRLELPSLIEVATAHKARDDLRCHFHSSCRARKEARDLRDQHTDVPPTITHKRNVKVQLYKLPSTLEEAYDEFYGYSYQMRGRNRRPRPMAITQIEPPFAIVDVNKAWCQLCGYTREEAVGSTLKELLQGPETNRIVAKELLSSLLEEGSDEEPEAVLVNYRSDGRKFRNHVRAGKIKTGARTTHFVGVFRKLSEDNGMNIISDEDLYANV